MEEQIRISFFKHQVNALDDEKLFKLFRKEGMAGYGVWWRLLEMLGGVKEHRLQRDYEDIAFKMYHPDLAELIKRVVEDYGLFKTNKDYFWNSSFTAQMEDLNARYQKRAAAGSKGGKRKAELKQSQSNAVAMLPENDSNATIDKIREEESRIEEIDTRSVVSSCEDIQRNSVSDNTPMQDEVSSVESRRRDFTCEVMACEGDYPNDMRKDFAGYWTQTLQENPQKMLFESKAAFDIPVRLAQWSKTEHTIKRPARPKKKEQVWTYNHYVSVYHTTEVKENWQTRMNEATGEMEYYRKIG